MKNYYFNIYADINGNHEVHADDCSFLPSELNREYIGKFNSCKAAIAQAHILYPNKNFDGCYYCCRECHRG